MSQQTEAVARRFLQAWNAGGESIVHELAASDLVVSYSHFPQPLVGVEAFEQALRQTHDFFPDLQIAAEEVISTGDTAVIRWSYRATHKKGQLFGVDAAGTTVEVAGITIYRIEGGMVRRESGVVDNFGLLMQLQGGTGT